MSLVHNTLVLSEKRFSSSQSLLVERETERERETEVVRELKESLSSWGGLGFFFQDLDAEVLAEEMRELKESASRDKEEAFDIIRLLDEGSSSDLQRIRQRGKILALRLLEYYPEVIRQKEDLLSKSRWRSDVVSRLLREDTLHRLSRSTNMGDEALLLGEVLRGLVEKLDEEEPGRVQQVCSLLEDVEWGTQTVTTIDIEGFDRLYDFLMSIFERAEGYDFYSGSWTGNRDQTMDEAESKLEELAGTAREALVKLLDEWEREHGIE